MSFLKFILPMVILLISFQTYSQDKDEFEKRIERMRLEHQRLKEQLFGDMFENNADFDKEFQEIIKQFQQGTFGDFFKGDNFNQFFKRLDPYKRMNSGQAHWMETPKERILILKINSPKDSPLSIKIEKGLIKISGETEQINEQKDEKGNVIAKSQSLSSFNQSFSVPMDVKESSAVIENVDGKIQIKFTKNSESTPTPVKKKIEIRHQEKPIDLEPLTPAEGDEVI